MNKKILYLLYFVLLLSLPACSDQGSSNSKSTAFVCGEGDETTIKSESELSEAEKEECEEIELERRDLLGNRRSVLDAR